MFLFDLIFGRKKDSTTSAPVPTATSAPADASAPGTRIHYDPSFIAALQEDHHILLEIFSGIEDARETGELLTVQTRLNQFRMVLMDHLLKENVRLYIYLEHMLANDPVSHELIHQFRHEMDTIGKVVVAFLGKYREIGIHPELAADFSRDLAAIGQALVARIRREEETLYPMYAPPGE
ncbi:MAG: hemerythrin domain-containing protein [Rhodocyclaceae bacterium]|nr:hemerythrin domain-containing protein [Rhodocyclaceae bacterium]